MNKEKQKTYKEYLKQAGYKESFIRRCNKESYSMIGMDSISKVQKAYQSNENTAFKYN